MQLVIALVKRAYRPQHVTFSLTVSRTILQADAMKEAGIVVDYAGIRRTDELIVDRIRPSRTRRPGRVYHVKFNPPKVGRQR